MTQNMAVRFELFVKDPQRSVDFYTRILGFDVVRSDDRYRSLRRDGVTIGIGYAEKLVEGHYFRPEVITDRKGLGVEIVLEVDDIEQLYEGVRRAGYPVHEELTRRRWGLMDFRIVDPDGYYLRPTSRD